MLSDDSMCLQIRAACAKLYHGREVMNEDSETLRDEDLQRSRLLKLSSRYLDCEIASRLTRVARWRLHRCYLFAGVDCPSPSWNIQVRDLAYGHVNAAYTDYLVRLVSASPEVMAALVAQSRPVHEES